MAHEKDLTTLSRAVVRASRVFLRAPTRIDESSRGNEDGASAIVGVGKCSPQNGHIGNRSSLIVA